MKEGEIDMNNFVLIKGGTYSRTKNISFKKGLPYSQISVTVSDFYIDDFVVTQRDFKETMGFNPSFFQNDDLPVELVDWYDAIEFCNKKSINDDLEPCYRINGTKNIMMYVVKSCIYVSTLEKVWNRGT